MPPQVKPAGGAGGSFDDPLDPQLPIPPGLQPGNEPSETAIPRAISAVADRVPTSVPQIFKNALNPSFGEGSQFEGSNEGNNEHTFSSMGNAFKTALNETKKTWTTKEGLKSLGKEAGNTAISSLTGMQPIQYAKQIQAGDYAGAGAGAVADAAQTAIAFAAHEPGGRLVGEHPAVGEAAAQEHMRTGGSTFDPRTGKNLAGSNNWAVSVAPEHTVVSNAPFTPEQYNAFVSQHRELLARNPNLNVGTWADGSGLHYLDLTATTPNKSAAVQMAQQMNQKAIYHLGRGEELAIGGTGEAIQSPFSVDYRAQALAAASPEKKPFTGYHLSNEKLDYLDPNRRGLVQKTGLPAGQESARLNLQTDTGVGQNAPGGFYAYSTGTRAEPSIAGRKYSHEVRGNFAMADITDPQWQEAGQSAYQDALQKTGNATVAQYASANAMEHAIRDAGFDGYTAKGSGIHFFFNGQPTQLVGAAAKSAELPVGKLSSEAGLVRSGEQRKGLGSAPAETGQAPDPWANLQYDRQATDQATAEQNAGKLPPGMTLVQRAQQLKEQLMSAPPKKPSASEQSAQAYRARSVGEQGIPYRAESHAQATMSPEEADKYTAGREDLTGQQQERVGVDLSKAPGFSVIPREGAPSWVKFHGEVPESAISKSTGASFPGEKSFSVQNGDPLSLLTGKERDQAMSARLGNQFTKILRQLPEVSDFEAAARKGASGRTWYQRSIDAFDAMRKLAPDYFKPEDADRFSNVLAATSPQQGVPLNLREALTFWKDWNDAGRPKTISEIQKAMRDGDIRPLTNSPSKLGNVVLALNDHDILSKTINKGQIEERNKYFKVGNFGKNLTKSFGNVTLDSWMGAFANVGEQDVAKPQFYHAMALRTRQAAQKIGWHPAEAQAAIWTFTKTLAEMSGWKAAGGKYYRPTDMLERLTPEKMKAYSNDFADIMKTDPDVRGKLSELGVDLNELDKRLKNITPKPQGEALEGADQGSLARSLKRNAARIGRKQRQLEGFTQYSKPPAQSELDLGEPEEGNTDFPFGGPLADAIRAGGK